MQETYCHKVGSNFVLIIDNVNMELRYFSDNLIEYCASTIIFRNKEFVFCKVILIIPLNRVPSRIEIFHISFDQLRFQEMISQLLHFDFLISILSEQTLE